jgi:hypothetical protein
MMGKRKEKYYNYVLNDLVSKTEIDHERELIRYPYTHNLTSLLKTIPLLYSHYLFSPFIKHCEEVYGLNEQEIDYVWGEYKDIINDKIENNG